ncbi:hypothetical protein ACFVXE_08025 [Streptomyces sp. NPDC058231]|uniref:hypothetical protein n=1 Tax=Streptomyces sp. NPDC058231 TaxID=3346392 RepID=UPI0036EDF9DD
MAVGGCLGAHGLRHHNWMHAVGGTTAVTIAALVAGILVIRRWLIQHNVTMRRDLESLATERRLVEDIARQVERQTATNQLRIESIQKRLDETLNQLSAERGQHAVTQRELREVTEEYNLLIQETLQSSADRFTRGPQIRGLTGVPSRQRARIPNTARGEHDRA